MPRKRSWFTLFLAICLLVEQPLWVLALPTPPADDVVPGLVIIVEGIGGLDMIGKSADHAFKRAGLPHEVHHFHWGHGAGKYLKDLQDTQHMLKKAEELAAFIRDYRAKHPNRPIYVVGKSAGTGIVLFAMQVLPPGSVERVILLSAGVAPTHDLRPALRASRLEVVSFYSRNDRYILGFGTSTFGTADRYYGKAAGLTGFVVPSALNEQDRQLYTRLIQVPYSSRMLREGVSNGSHTSTSLPMFVSAEVVPWLR
ncbi:MAG: alpha/beta fold hydrolase [Planctomycetes bacterium]|nr:alpha/beta fold hydrolase [Planctomycetota bacterium]